MSAALLNPPTPSFAHLGEPAWWTCPHCTQHVLLYPALGNNHRCANYNPHAAPRTFHFYYVLADDHRVASLRLVGAIADDPLLGVESFGPDGRLQRWNRYTENGELVFCPPDAEWSREHVLRYDDRIQKHEPIPRAELERRALRGRHSA